MLAFILFLATAACLVGIVKPIRKSARKFFAIGAVVFFMAMMSAIPESTPEEIAQRRANVDRKINDEVVEKARPGIEGMVPYTRAEFKKTYALVGPKAFSTLDELERGAFYVAAESGQCDKVSMGAVSLTKSSKNAPVWFVDCENGNRFLISKEQAEHAVERSKASKLAQTDLAKDCTTTSLAMCDASASQRSVNEIEVVTTCDMAVEQVLISDSSMEWSWNFSYGSGDEVQVTRSFTAENAFGANLKHRYLCDFDTSTKRIKRLVIDGPMGAQKVI